MLVERQWLLASITSEVGTYGATRTSHCALEVVETTPPPGRFRLVKDATTGSYCAHADAILVTCRRDADEDQERRHQESATDPEHAGDEPDRCAHRQDEEDIDRNVGDREVELHARPLF